MKLVDVLRVRLTDPVLESIWEEMLAGWSTSSEEERGVLRSWVQRKRDDLLAFAAECVDEEELEQYAALQYIEFRAQWQALNNRINYAMVTSGATHPGLVYRSALMSQLLGALEGLLDPVSVGRIMSFLSEPIATRPREAVAA
jgi:hypothetical protein